MPTSTSLPLALTDLYSCCRHRYPVQPFPLPLVPQIVYYYPTPANKVECKAGFEPTAGNTVLLFQLSAALLGADPSLNLPPLSLHEYELRPRHTAIQYPAMHVPCPNAVLQC